MPYLAYEEPGITTILSLTSFVSLLNCTRYIFDRLLYCGIVGEILIGVIWGLPVGGTSWLSRGAQETIQAFGYLGLIGLVFEGGISTNLGLLRKSAYMSMSIATVGLLMPIALSFILVKLPFSSSSGSGKVYPSPLAAFSAGASMCSTSLGTTFAILSSAGLQQTRVGVVLVGAAMMDDVVGLVMVNIVTTLGSGDTGGWSIARPIVASFGMFSVTLPVVAYVLRPAWSWLVALSTHIEGSKVSLRSIVRWLSSISHLSFLLSTGILMIFVTIAAFIDASVLFGAFIAGAVVNYLWEVREFEQEATNEGAINMYKEYYKSAMDMILVPFFFASVGFSIPITDMFSESVVWKGIIYALFMAIAKGLVSAIVYSEYFSKSLLKKKNGSRDLPIQQQRSASATTLPSIAYIDTTPPHMIALLVGVSMIARGEIGFLIASLSQSSGTLTLQFRDGSIDSSGEQIFLVIIWAVVLCTIAGPVGVGFIVRRVRENGHDYGWM